ncbi:hypothetical protein F5148DRAFT_977431, partial [Russula earlei]
TLDPNCTSNRDAVQEAATEILGHAVKSCAHSPFCGFPSPDFRMVSQRPAVGMGEDAIVMYDLKKATRLYVVECQSRRLWRAAFRQTAGVW